MTSICPFLWRPQALLMLRAERRGAEAAAAVAADRRSSLLSCLDVAFSLYRWSWAQTSTDILVFATHEARGRFSPGERERLQGIYEAVRDAKNRRKGVGSAKDMTSFEQGQAKYADAAISIRRAVGGPQGGVDGRGESCVHSLGGRS